MKNYEINLPKKEEILRDLTTLKNNFRYDIGFDCIVTSSEDDFIDILEESILSNKIYYSIEVLKEEFAEKVADYLNIKPSDILLIQEDVPEFSKYIDKALNSIRVMNFAELENVLSNTTIKEYFKEQFENNLQSIVFYLQTITMINYIESLSDKELFDNYVSMADKQDFIEKYPLVTSVTDIRLSYNNLITLIPF